MLPTEDRESGIYEGNKSKILVAETHKRLTEDPHNNWAPHHLYILSDDSIEEGDWWMNTVNKYVHQRKYSDRFNQENEQVRRDCKKIIATTDPKLTVEYQGYEHGTGDKIDAKVHLLQIPQPLIEYYAKHQPEEVELEYEIDGVIPYGCELEIWKKLKLQNSEVVWVENKFQGMRDIIDKHKKYTREEVENIAWEIGTYFENIDRNDFKKGFDYVMKKLYKE
jgi:hypothetical protein